MKRLILMTAAFWTLATPAVSQEAPLTVPNTTQVFEPDYFNQFAPQTAADMVARLPGFDIRGGEGEARGFGQATLNILINGRRPSSKSSGANEILSRIPANTVTQIEILDGSTLDIPGLSGQVANISAKSGELSGSWNYAARFEKGSKPQWGDAGINFSAKRGNLEAVGSLSTNQFSFTEQGEETFFDGTGTVLQDRDEKIRFNLDLPIANLNLTWLRDNGDIANLNVSGSRRNQNTSAEEDFSYQTEDALSGESFSAIGQDTDTYEIGGDYSLDAPLIGREGRLKFIGLHRTEDYNLSSRFTLETEGSDETRQEFLRDDISKEYIGRAEYTWKTGETNDWSLALEGVVNTLDSDTTISQNETLYPNENVQVEEDRFQAELTRSWALNNDLTAQSSLGVEYSKISSVTSVETDISDERSDSFLRPKGFVNLSYKLDKDWTLRTQVERSVAQLDFDAFVSNVSFVSGTADNGNGLVPEQNWNTNIEIEHQNSTGLSGRAKLFYKTIEDPIVQLLFEDGTQGEGNLDSDATSYGIEANLTWVLDDVLKGLRVSAEGHLSDSSIRDVVTKKNRSRSGEGLWEYVVSSRWDIANTDFALEAQIENSRNADSFRIDERTDNVLHRPEIEFAAIHKSLFGMQWTAKVQNIANFELQRERLIYDTTRNGDLIRREETNRTRDQRFSIEVTDTF